MNWGVFCRVFYKSLSFGVRGDTKDTHWMQGVMDEVAIFDEALSQEEIQNIINNGLQTTILDVSPLGGTQYGLGQDKERRIIAAWGEKCPSTCHSERFFASLRAWFTIRVTLLILETSPYKREKTILPLVKGAGGIFQWCS